MEANPLQNTEPGSTNSNGSQNVTQQQSILAQTFYRILQQVMNKSTENGNSGA